jgi:hypothetical protein
MRTNDDRATLAPSAPGSDVLDSAHADDVRRAMRSLFAHGRFHAALVAAERVIARSGEDPEARAISQAAAERLGAPVKKRVPQLRAFPRRTPTANLRGLPLDPLTAFVLETIDGTLAPEDLADATGLSLADLASVVDRLSDMGAIAWA